MAVCGALVFAIGTVGSAIVLGRVTDQVVLPAFEGSSVGPATVLGGILGLLAITVLRVVGTVGRRYYGSMTGERIQRTYRAHLSRKYLRLPLSWHQRNPTGELLAYVDNDAEMATQVMMPLPFTMGVVFLTVFSAVSLVVVDPVLALLALAVFPALALLNRIYSRRVEAPAARVQADVGVVSTVAHESFDGAMIVKTLGREAAEQERFDETVETLRRDRVEVGFLTAAFDTVMDLIPTLGIIAVILIGTYRIRSGEVTPGELVQVASLFTMLSFPMRVFGFFLTSLPPSVVAHQRLDVVFTEGIEPEANPVRQLPSGPIGVSADGVTFTYPTPSGDGVEGGPVLVGVDLEIHAGETVAIVGSTGSGKSTLCSLICGLVPPAEGVVRLGGVLIDKLDASDRTDAVSLVFQESFLFADSIEANIDVIGSADLDAVVAAASIARADQFIRATEDGYSTVVGERGVTLSGGQRQRIALARALVRGPRLLVLDDATSAVDAAVEQEILAGLRGQVEATVVVVAQRVSTIELADRVIFLSGGRIAATGTHLELLQHPAYHSLVTAYEKAAS